MRALGIVRSPAAPGCAELAERGLVDASGCCEACHSAEDHAPGFVLGPCRVVSPDGEEAFVCCQVREQVLRGQGRSGPREVEEMIGR